MAFTFIDVKNLADLKKKLADLPPVQPGFKRLYRGQTRDYDGLMIPSFYRKGRLLDERYYSWKLAGQRIVKEEILTINIDSPKENDASLNFPIDALMQHYGGCSGGLDVTDDLKVAMWFAQFKHHQATTPELIMQPPLEKAALFELTKAYYLKSDAAFSLLYVLDCELWVAGKKPKIGDCVDLQKWFGEYTSRPARQKGWYIYSDESNVYDMETTAYNEHKKAYVTSTKTIRGDLKEFVNTVFRIPKSLREEINNGEDEATLYYFPTPDLDDFYKRILRSCFIETEEGIFKRIIQITQYYNALKNSDAVENIYQDNITVQYFYNFSKILQQRNASRNHFVNIEGIKHLLADALIVKMEIPNWHLIIDQPQGVEKIYIPIFEELRLPKENLHFNFFIEFHNTEMVAAEPPKGYTRGAWVVRHHNFISFQYFYSKVKNLGDFDSALFFDDGNGILKIQDPDGKLSNDAKKDLQNSLTSALRVIQSSQKIIFLPHFFPFNKAGGK